MITVKRIMVGIMMNIIGFVYAQNKEIKTQEENISSQENETDSVHFQASIRKMVLAMGNDDRLKISNTEYTLPEAGKPGIYYLNVFPNPLNKTVQVSFKTIANINLIVHVVDKKGKVVYAQSYFDHCGDFFELIQLNKELNGIYYLKLYTNESSIQRKLIMNF
jgi:hypothetical protein